MFRNYLKTALRSLWRQKFYSGLNIFGLSLGIAVGLILFQFIQYHLSFDRYHKDSEQLYKIVTEIHLDDGSVIYDEGTPLAITTELKKAIPAINDQAVLLKIPRATVTVSTDGQVKHFAENGNIAFVKPEWFDLFDYSWINGNAHSYLSTPMTAVVTRKIAKKYFGMEDAIGKILKIDSKNSVTITGILKDHPGNTDLRTDIFISRESFNPFYPALEQQLTDEWGNINSTTQSFIRVPANVPLDKVEGTMASLVKQHFDPSVAHAYQFHLLPLKEMHFDGRFGGSVRKPLLISLALAGIFLIIIACFNFINLASAQNARRAKEVGTRKLLGSTPVLIFWQFITEITCIVLLAAVLSFLWMAFSLPMVNNWLQLSLQLNFLGNRTLLAGTIALLVFVILGSGIYPAVILSRYTPSEALKKQRGNGHTSIFRKGLVVVQNCIVQGLIICSLIIALQVQHLKTADLGFNKNAVLMVPIPSQEKKKMAYLKHQLESSTEIKSISFCYQPPSSEKSLGGSIKLDNRPWENFNVASVVGDAGYLKTFQLSLLAGSNIRENDEPNEVLINQTLLNKLGFQEPVQAIGHQLVLGSFGDRVAKIAGVVKDFNVHALYTPIEPLIITTNQSRYRYAAIRVASTRQSEIRDRIRAAWEDLYPENVFEYHYLDEQIDDFYKKEDLLSKLINSTTFIAIIISCLGLLGLISFVTIQRTKEIGIRKVLGASVANIFTLLSKDLLTLLFISVLITSPVTWYCMNRWLESFAYRINISWWIFPAAGLLSVVIALFTVSFQAIKAAVSNPVDSLRTE